MDPKCIHDACYNFANSGPTGQCNNCILPTKKPHIPVDIEFITSKTLASIQNIQTLLIAFHIASTSNPFKSDNMSGAVAFTRVGTLHVCTHGTLGQGFITLKRSTSVFTIDSKDCKWISEFVDLVRTKFPCTCCV
jgi:hypothetical protein